MQGDTLSDVLRTVRLRGAAFYAVRARDDWAVEAPPAAEIADTVVPGAGHVMEYHVLLDGVAWAALPGQPAVRLAPGDVVLFPQGDPHVLCSAPGVPPLRFSPDWVRATQHEPKPMPVTLGAHGSFAWGARTDAEGATAAQVDGDGATGARQDGDGRAGTRQDGNGAAGARQDDDGAGGARVSELVCGFLGCDRGPFNPLLDALPRLLHVPADGEDAWLRQTMRQALRACAGGAPGGGALAERLSETMFIDAVRRHPGALPDQATGWLAGVRHRQIGRALALIHADPRRPWTLEALAGAAALSRSAFCERFVRLVGVAPARYLARWRIAVAATLLRQGRSPVAAIALEVGYESEAAFTRAFARLVGMPPSRWRTAPATAGATSSSTRPAML